MSPRRRDTANWGNAGDLMVARDLTEDGWLVASRRHTPGAGDLMAIKPLSVAGGDRYLMGMLIEVKRTTKPETLWQGFRRVDREALLIMATAYNLQPMLAHVIGDEINYLEPAEWPW